MRKFYWRTSLVLFAALALSQAGLAPGALAAAGAPDRRASGLGTISGTILDGRGKPVAGALVKILRDGLNEVVRETKSSADGRFTTRVTPGRYLVRALAQGFTPATFTAVQVSPSTELVYQFNLQPAGEGRTEPERRADRDDPKFKIRSQQIRRSVFHAGEAETGVADEVAAEETEGAEGVAAAAEDENVAGKARVEGYVETFVADSANPELGGYAGLNFAFKTPVTRDLDMIFAGQTGEFERLEATARLRAGARHRVSATFGGARLPVMNSAAVDSTGTAGLALGLAGDDKLGQFSVRAVDEWVVRDGIVLVLGLDYSRFFGAGGDDSLTPRLGVGFDVNARTRLHAAYAPGNSPATRADAETFEDDTVVFKETPGQAVALVDGRAVMERTSRLEFGVERVIGENSSVEATAFFDTVDDRGVALFSSPLAGLTDAGSAALLSIANQQGGARGLRVVYTRRISQRLKASAGYAFGRGQQLSPEGFTSPEQLFQDAFFQTAAAQLDASVADGMTVRTVLRFSPRAAVFAVDPFAGRLAVYDPSLSILVTQELPNFGLPVRAQATLDARNVLDTLTGVEDGENFMSLGALRRTVRGGISLRF
ncbi:MAG TPA: carboxypeptidase-like regulatory domain-containing protein [Pyrinomonadaceae bacterium]|nr:carboxypeptidase-like regulatory domain-containing protein [Pyrinomonadaceae bacterium]